MPYPPEQWQEEWKLAVMLNSQEDVADLVGDALDQRECDMPRNGPEWRLLCRLALITAAKAHGINSRREWGDYSDGWPDQAEVPMRLVPSLPGTDAGQTSRQSATETSAPAPSALVAPMVSASFRAFVDDRGVGIDELRGTAWTTNTTRQANIALEKFVSLIGDLPVDRITSETAEKLRAKLKEMPNLYGRTIYAGLSAEQALIKARRLRRDIANDADRVVIGGKKVPPAQAKRWAEAVTLKTINRDMTFFTAWGKWMLRSPVRRRQLHDGMSPFTGLLFTKRELKAHARSRGQKRTVFSPEQINALLSAPLMQTPPPFASRSDKKALLVEAQFWSVLIGLYTGLRLGEIAQLYPTDIKCSRDFWYLDLTEDGQRSFKTEAGERQVPLHPTLVQLGLPELAAQAATAGRMKLFEGMVTDPIKKQAGANISKWFLRFRRSCGVSGKETPFHSLRHTFAQALRETHAGQDILIDQILGHEPGSVGAMHYAEQLTLEKKHAAISVIRFEPNAVARSPSASGL